MAVTQEKNVNGHILHKVSYQPNTNRCGHYTSYNKEDNVALQWVIARNSGHCVRPGLVAVGAV